MSVLLTFLELLKYFMKQALVVVNLDLQRACPELSKSTQTNPFWQKYE